MTRSVQGAVTGCRGAEWQGRCLVRAGAHAAQPQRLFLSGTEHAAIDGRNLAALRTLFAVAARLAVVLGESWMLVLGTVNCLDCILATPRQSAPPQARCPPAPPSPPARCCHGQHHPHASDRRRLASGPGPLGL